MSDMAENRSSWNIDRGKRPLGLELVNPKGQLFFIYAEKFVALHRHPGEYVRVKNKDNHPEAAVYYYPGEIYGRLEYLEGEFCRISLYIGYAGQVIVHDKATDHLVDLHSEQHHLIPASEVSSLAHVLACMYVQRERFNELKMMSGAQTPFS